MQLVRLDKTLGTFVLIKHKTRRQSDTVKVTALCLLRKLLSSKLQMLVRK